VRLWGSTSQFLPLLLWNMLRSYYCRTVQPGGHIAILQGSLCTQLRTLGFSPAHHLSGGARTLKTADLGTYNKR
jgi:hypothetical protein